MGRVIAAVATAPFGFLPKLGSALAVLWLEFTALAFDSYRPELHYMRGPGPAWRKKYGQQ